MKKTRVTQRLKEKISGPKASTNRSSDLVALTEEFNALKHKIRRLIEALRAQHASFVSINRTRLEVAKRVAALSENSPISDQGGALPRSQSTTANSEAAPEPSEMNSYLSVHTALAHRHAMYTERYAKFIVEYSMEWEKVLVTRVSASLKVAERQRLELDHYQSKVEGIRQDVNKLLARAKIVESKLKDRLKRNEDKFQKAKSDYASFAADLCTLIEEVTARCWKDLHPILLKLTQFDTTLVNDEGKLLGNLMQVSSALQKVAEKHSLNPQTRLRDLKTLNANMVSTREAEKALEGSALRPALMMETDKGGLFTVGNGALSASSSIGGDSGDPFGGHDLSRNASLNSHASYGMSDMLSVAANAAPPPTLEMVHDMNRMSFDQPSRMYDLDRDISQRSIPLAPPPMAAPPPPPPASAPVFSMYSGPVDLDKIPPVSTSPWSGPQEGGGNTNDLTRSSPPSTFGNPWSSSMSPPNSHGSDSRHYANINPFGPPGGNGGGVSSVNFQHGNTNPFGSGRGNSGLSHGSLTSMPYANPFG